MNPKLERAVILFLVCFLIFLGLSGCTSTYDNDKKKRINLVKTASCIVVPGAPLCIDIK